MARNRTLHLRVFIVLYCPVGSALPILLFVLLVLLQMDSTPSSVYWKLFRLWLPYEEHPTIFFELAPAAAHNLSAATAAVSPTASLSPTLATGPVAATGVSGSTVGPAAGSLGGSEKATESQTQTEPCHWIVIHEDKSLMQYESRVRLFHLWQRVRIKQSYVTEC